MFVFLYINFYVSNYYSLVNFKKCILARIKKERKICVVYLPLAALMPKDLHQLKKNLHQSTCGVKNIFGSYGSYVLCCSPN